MNGQKVDLGSFHNASSGDTISEKKEVRKSNKLENDLSKTEKPVSKYPKTSNENGQNNSNSSCNKIKKIKWYIVAIIVIIVVLVVVLVPVLKKKKERNTDIISSTTDSTDDIIEPIPKEFDILTEVGKLKQISVTQKSKEETKLNNYTIIDDYLRKTDYDIYFISEEEAKGDNRLFYTKMYSGVVSIRSECVTEKQDCTPQPLLSLTSVERNLRFLEDTEKYKDQPIPLCLFNITDNNVITTLTCPESLSDLKKNEIILDLYFFRPPAAQRPDKNNDNITLNIDKDEENRTYIHETNGGYCNIYNNWYSHCTTDMNTTLDPKGNLLNYNEQAITEIDYDEANSYKKDKVTTLIDTSDTVSSKDIKNFENAFNYLLNVIKPYMNEELQFSESDYNDLLNVIKDKNQSKELQSYEPQKTRDTFRRLAVSKIQYYKNADIFFNKITPIQVNLGLKIDTGINSKIMGAYGTLTLDDREFIFSSIEETSSLDDLINTLSIISKSANILGSQLYNEIYDRLDCVLNEISIKIGTLEELLKYYRLYDVFQSTLVTYSYKKLPSDIVRLSNELVNKLSNIFNNIRTGEIKQNTEILTNDVYSFISNLHQLIRITLDNLDKLSDTLLTKNNTFTIITNHYFNNTSSSYVNIIQKIKDILETYFINEFEKINPKIETLLKYLEKNSDYALKNDLFSLRNLYTNLKNKIFTINDATDADLQTVLSNLENSLEYSSEIIKEIITYIRESMNIKTNGYFITDEEINNFNNSLNSIIIEAEKVAKKLDDVSLIDKVFDEIMIRFRDSYVYTMKFMEEIKSGNFTLEEDVLNKTVFTKNITDAMENELTALCDEILSKVKQENNAYITKIKEYFEQFLSDNLDDLNDIIVDLNIFFSEEAIKALANSLEYSLNISLDKFTKITANNIELARQYIDLYYNTINNDASLKKLLQNYYLDYDTIYRPYYDSSRTHQFPYFDIISSKMRTSAYLSKYNSFMANLNYSEEYLINQLNYDLVNEYREIFTQLKEQLQSILNNKLSEKFPDFNEINFFEKHKRVIDKLNTRLDKYFSTDVFDNKFLRIINESINTNINLIKTTKEYLSDKHESMKGFRVFGDSSSDICIAFRRKVCYGCTNCVSYTYFYDRFCFILTPYHYNYLLLEKATYESLRNFGDFNLKFEAFSQEMNSKISRYNSILKNMNLNISEIKQETLDENIALNYLENIKNWVELTIKGKYGNILLQEVYNYYKSNIDEKMGNIFSDVFHRWENAYITLREDVRNNEEYIKYSLFEFTEVAENYRTIIQVDLTENYFNSIILLERAELNYTISYYYNYLLKLMSKSYKYITQRLPTNENDFNDILKERKEEIKKQIDNFTLNILKSETECRSLDNQLNILKVNESDFFQAKSILKKNINETDEALLEAIDEIWIIEQFLPPSDKNALVMRYYLENREYGKLIEELYEPLDKGVFIYLDLNKFKDAMMDNWVFESEDFVNIINTALYETNKEIKNELNLQIESYQTTIENEINKFFNDNIENIINSLYISQIKDLTSSQIDNINSYISQIINEFENVIKSLANKIKNNPGVYRLYTNTIENNIKILKNSIINQLNNSFSDTLNIFYENIYKKVYTDCFQSKLSDYLNKARDSISSDDFGDYELLNSTFNIGEIIYNLTDEVVSNYKNIVIKKIYMKYSEYCEKIKSQVNSANNIKDNLLSIYETELLPVLTSENNCTSLTTCTLFELNSEISQYNLNNIINQRINEIKNEIELMKNDNNEINFECNLDFTNSGNKVIKPICDSLKTFLSFENEGQVTKINSYIQNVIQSNLDEFLNTVVPTFGDEFFERIIDYNINFQIVNLYENLHYSLAQTVLYYHELFRITSVRGLPTDLKDRIYKLNDLDLTILDKVRDIKSLSEKKLNELINDLKDYAKEVYNNFIKDNEVIKNSFSSNILEKIDFTLDEIMPDIEENYQNILEKYLKEKFMNEFSDILDEKSQLALEIFYEEKEKLIGKLNDLFSFDKDNDLKEVNEKINTTIISIQNYKDFLYSEFKFTTSANNFFLNYGVNKLLPIFRQFKVDLYETTKEKITTEINKNSEEIEKLNPDPIKQILNGTYALLFDDYFYHIQKAIANYGDTEDIYYDNLIKTQEDNKDNLRRSDGIEEEEGIIEEERRIIESRYIEDSFELILNKIRNTKNYIENLYAFVRIENILNKYKTNLNIDYKNISNMITENRYYYDIDVFLKEKLTNLTNILYNYFDQINTIFYYFKQDLVNTVYHINISLNLLSSITKNVLNREYQGISDSTTRINKIRTNYIGRYPTTLKYNHKSENMMHNVTTYIDNLTDYAEFKLDLNLEGNGFKIPKVKASIVDGTVGAAQVRIISGNGACIEKGHYFNIKPNAANQTVTVEYNTKSNLINITTITNIKEYNYTITYSKSIGDTASEPITVDNYVRAIKCENITRERDDPIIVTVEEKNIVESQILNK